MLEWGAQVDMLRRFGRPAKSWLAGEWAIVGVDNTSPDTPLLTLQQRKETAPFPFEIVDDVGEIGYD